MSLGIVLVHGYTGSQNDLMLLFQRLCSYYGPDSVINTALPFHGMDQVPDFDYHGFEQTILQNIDCFRQKEQKQKLILIGHSTGGTLILSCMLRHSITPDLLVLAGVPRQIDMSYMERWEKHSADKIQPKFSSFARMISLINFTGKAIFDYDFPVLIMNGEKDDLVLSDEAFKWNKNFKGEKTTVIVPDSGHHFFKNIEKKDIPSDIILRAVHDLANNMKKEKNEPLDQLIRVEPGIKQFLAKSPNSVFHLSQCPSAERVMGKEPIFKETINTEPVFANIEITTNCNLKCRFCARTRLGIKGKNMPSEMFPLILAKLPHAYRITLVGLGEPLLHPDIVNFVKIAVRQKRRVALVTNAMNLDRAMSKKLINAGLDSITFSIDGPDQKLAGKLRPGTDFEKVIEHIRMFTSFAHKSEKDISMAVFSALSTMSFDSLKPLIDLVAELGVHVLMLSDLNFKYNLKECLWNNMNNQKANLIRDAIRYSFSKKLPVMSVHGLEEFGLKHRYIKFLAFPCSKIYERSRKHTNCLSPWQTIPVNVNGDVYVCDCQPGKIVGNLFKDSFDCIWNSAILKEQRTKMRGAAPPDACKICPRF